jgi:iron(III) transport system substrate-binding protein
MLGSFFFIGMLMHLFLTPGEAFSEPIEELVRSLDGLSAEARLEKLVDGAKKEGNVVFYGTTSAEDARQYLEAFRRRYPFLETNHYRAGGFRLVNKLVTEAKAGRYEPDIIQLSSLVSYEVIAANLFAKYVSPERKYIRREFMDREGKWTAMQHVRVTLGYNTETVKSEEVPKSYHDLLNPRWKGKVVIDNQDQDVLSALIDAWGEEKAFALFKGLAKNGVSIRRSRTLQAQLLAAGEFQIAAFLHGYRPAEMQRMGAPVGLVTLEPFVTKPSPVFLPKHSPHPHAAILLYDYLLSEECQKIVGTKIGRGPARIGIKEKYPELHRNQYQIVDPETSGPKLRDLRKFFNKTFGIGG